MSASVSLSGDRRGSSAGQAMVRRLGPHGLWPALLFAPPLVASAALPAPAATVVALAAVILLGVPHGALDGEIGRDMLRPRLGWGWSPVFALPYLATAGLVLLAWRAAPLHMLAAFLLLSVIHFGAEEEPGEGVFATLVRGGLPIAVPTLAQPAATAALLGTVAGVPLALPPGWLHGAALLWAALAAVWAIRMVVSGRHGALARPALVAAAFVALPPITAFALYFVCVHAPAHMRALIENPDRAPRVRDMRSAILLSLPFTGATLLLGALLWPTYAAASPAPHLLALTIQGLAALTLPHMLLEGWLDRRQAEGQPARLATPHPRVMASEARPSTMPRR